ncbi:hypothetical protein AUF62_01865 [archaeon 13_1_20CM_52_20]|nr:MAG: hypothetical protein AUF62_01865 [archaeon 13_1_20CM_52_20]
MEAGPGFDHETTRRTAHALPQRIGEDSRRIVGWRGVYATTQIQYMLKTIRKSAFVPALSDHVYLSEMSFAIAEDSSFISIPSTFRPEARVRFGRWRFWLR